MTGRGCTGRVTWPGGPAPASWCSPGGLMTRSRCRGCRAEPGEVSAVLGRAPGVALAVVVVREDVPGERRLAGYVVPASGARPEEAALRDWLADRLPDYLVPPTVMVLAELP